VAEQGPKRKLAAILSADVAGYGRLMQDDEAATVATLQEYRTAIGRVIDRHGGRIVNAPGDNILAEFASAVEAVQAAVEIQKSVEGRNVELPPARRMEVRIGVNLGDVIEEEDGTIYGDGVNIAARIEALAEAGGICISSSVFDAVEGKLEFGFYFLGEQQVKNIARPINVYRVHIVPGAAPSVSRAERRQWQWAALAAVVVLVAGAVAVWQLTQRTGPETAPGVASGEAPALELPDKPSIAVLPFKNLSGDPEQERFVDGITDNIITELSRFRNLFVIASNSVFTYKGKAVKVQQVARELGVQYVLEGSVQREGDTLRITAQLVDATTGHHVWAESYDRDATDFFAVQDEVTQKIVGALGAYEGALEKAVRERARRKPTDSLEAYDYYLLGNEYVERYTKEDLAESREMFEKAIELDPEFARAHASLAIAHYYEWKWEWSDSPTESQKKAFDHAKKSVALDPTDAYNHWTLGVVNMSAKRFEQGTADYEMAMALNPNDADVLASWGRRLAYLGRAEEGVALMKKAMRLNPYHPPLYLYLFGTANYAARRYEEAIAVLERMPIHNPESRLYRAASYAQLGRDAEAQAMVAEILEEYPDFSSTRWAEIEPYKDQADRDHLLDGLRKAGLPE